MQNIQNITNGLKLKFKIKIRKIFLNNFIKYHLKIKIIIFWKKILVKFYSIKKLTNKKLNKNEKIVNLLFF